MAEIDPERSWPGGRSGRLTDLPGVGDTTARVIAEALAGETPAYLRAPRGAARPTLDGPRPPSCGPCSAGDCHSHSDWSDGGSPIAEMAEAAAALGHEYLALTDHSPRLTVAHGLDAERLRRQLEVVAALNEELAPFRILTGIEVDILEDGSLDQDEDLLARLDVVVASVHSKLRWTPAHDPPHGGRHREPPHRHPRPLHGAHPRRPGPAAVAGSTTTRCSRPAPAPARPSRSTPGPNASIRPTPFCVRRRRARVPGLHRHRRPCTRPAGVAGRTDARRPPRPTFGPSAS